MVYYHGSKNGVKKDMIESERRERERGGGGGGGGGDFVGFCRAQQQQGREHVTRAKRYKSSGAAASLSSLLLAPSSVPWPSSFFLSLLFSLPLPLPNTRPQLLPAASPSPRPNSPSAIASSRRPVFFSSCLFFLSITFSLLQCDRLY